MKCIAINLDIRADRRAALEKSFHSVRHVGWDLEVFSAINAAEAQSFPGAASPAEKGCFLSHRAALGSALDGDDPVWIVEDDAMFSHEAFAVAPQALGHTSADLLFTNVAGTAPQDPLLLLSALPRAGEVRILDLRSITFAGTISYLVRGDAKRRVVERLNDIECLNEPYDLLLRTLVRSGAISAVTTLPFLTGLSEHAHCSQIKDGRSLRDDVWNAVRQLLYVDVDLVACRSLADRLDENLDDERARIMGRLVGARISEDFRSSN